MGHRNKLYLQDSVAKKAQGKNLSRQKQCIILTVFESFQALAP